ncbi:MAG: sulfurtransferase [endosymbiont of Galathealinum brachiosum]|uniref:Sulfurtransferase n=1 Tax=endosymbiont of Galathealinum brachiosum TaxID=2200906 RepID=A0A370DM94_9GAMM|nr:MAG: sulfurtransferase [endosymbiont of Galathealinum brachiosum]
MISKTMIIAAIMAMSVSVNTLAAPKPSDPKKQTPWDLYVDSTEAYDLKMKLGDKALFIDVREPAEIMFTGFTDVVDVNIPFMLVNTKKWNSKKSVLLMKKNTDFISDIERALVNRGMTKDDAVLIMCRSGGTRGAPAANVLFDKGFTKVYVVTDGFEGGTLKEGDKKGWRLKNGWKNSGLPWSYKLNEEKMYFKKSF